MRRSSAITVGLLVALLAGAAWAFGIMLAQRFSGGEVYPPYSTLRADPVGAKALFEAVDRLGNTSCERNYKRLAKLQEATGDANTTLQAPSRRGQTLVLLNVPPAAFDDGEDLDAEPLVNFAAAGGRVVITTTGLKSRLERLEQAADKRQQERREQRQRKRAPQSEPPGPSRKGDGKEPKVDPPVVGRQDRKGQDEKTRHPVAPPKSLREMLAVTISQEQILHVPKEGHAPDTPEGIAVLTGRLPRWFSNATLDFTSAESSEKERASEEGKLGREAPRPKEDKTPANKPQPAAKGAWKVLATVEKHPVLAEQRFSHGSIVIATDTRFASNQELMLEPATEFLAWLIGDARHVIFDETHLGTQENPGIMALARRFRLHGFFLGGVILFALFVWQSSSSLVPPSDAPESASRVVAGQGAVAGLVSLLRRGIPRARLLRTCFEEWVRQHPRPGAALQSRMEKARALLPLAETKRLPRGALVALYQRLCDTLHPKRNQA